MDYKDHSISLDPTANLYVATHDNYDGPESSYPVHVDSTVDGIKGKIDEWIDEEGEVDCPDLFDADAVAGFMGLSCLK